MNSIIRAASRITLGQIGNRLSLIKKQTSSGFIVQKKWAHNLPLSYDFARERIMLVLHLFDKIDPNKLTLDSHFVNDLGLDSLDHVEIIMQLEDEFKFEIPDKDAEKLLRPSDILRYITDKEEAYKELQDLQAHHHHHDHDHEHGHGHDDHSKSHTISSGQNGNPGDQKRGFCSWATTSKRFASKGFGMGEEGAYPTSFNEDPPKELKIEEIQDRVLKVCAKYDKIDSSKLQLASHFVDDLGLDSLDHVEIMMELEDEFGLEIPDQDAEKLLRPADIARYVFQKEEARSINPEDRNF